MSVECVMPPLDDEGRRFWVCDELQFLLPDRHLNPKFDPPTGVDLEDPFVIIASRLRPELYEPAPPNDDLSIAACVLGMMYSEEITREVTESIFELISPWVKIEFVAPSIPKQRKTLEIATLF